MNVHTDLECPWCNHVVPLLSNEPLAIGDKGHYKCVKCNQFVFWMYTGERLATLGAVPIETTQDEA